MGNDLGIGFRHKDVAGLFQLGSQFLEILDDAVVHNGHDTGRVGVGIVRCRTSVGRPTRVGNSRIPVNRVGKLDLFEVLQLALSASTKNFSFVDDGDTRGVISPVFQSTQALNQAVRGQARACNSDNSTHVLVEFPVQDNHFG